MAAKTKRLKEILANIIHEETQFPENRNIAYITVSQVGKIIEPGSLDFGGSEYTEAEIHWLEPKARSDEDKYGWWNLQPGSYRVEFNEGVELPDGTGVLLQIWNSALENGVSHPTEVITRSRNPLTTQMRVSDGGVRMKENARLSELRLL